MRKLKRRDKPVRKLKRRKVKVDRVTAMGKCKECESLYLYCIENGDPSFLESKPVKAKRFNKVVEKELCLVCLTGEKSTIKAWEILNLHVHKGSGLKVEKKDAKK